MLRFAVLLAIASLLLPHFTDSFIYNYRFNRMKRLFTSPGVLMTFQESKDYCKKYNGELYDPNGDDFIFHNPHADPEVVFWFQGLDADNTEHFYSANKRHFYRNFFCGLFQAMDHTNQDRQLYDDFLHEEPADDILILNDDRWYPMPCLKNKYSYESLSPYSQCIIRIPRARNWFYPLCVYKEDYDEVEFWRYGHKTMGMNWIFLVKFVNKGRDFDYIFNYRCLTREYDYQGSTNPWYRHLHIFHEDMHKVDHFKLFNKGKYALWRSAVWYRFKYNHAYKIMIQDFGGKQPFY